MSDCSGVKDFAIQPLAPAALPCLFFSSVLRGQHNDGDELEIGHTRRRVISSMPFMSGMLRPVIAISTYLRESSDFSSPSIRRRKSYSRFIKTYKSTGCFLWIRALAAKCPETMRFIHGCQILAVLLLLIKGDKLRTCHALLEAGFHLK